MTPPLRTVLLSVTLSLLIGGLGAWLFHEPPPDVVHMNMRGTLAAFERDIAKLNLAPAQQKTQATLFTATLEGVLYAYSIEKNVVIVVSPALVAGGA